MKQKLLRGFNLRAILAFLFLSYIPITYAQYCNSSFSNVNWEFLTNVTFAGINNTTAGNTGGPVNYTSQVASVSAGSTYTLSVTIDPDGNDYVFAYIDWNQNGVLNDAGEVYSVASNVGTAGPYTVSVAVPGTAAAGNTRMRVICQFNNTTTDPCIAITYGEAEDYTVNVSTSLCGGTPAPGNTTSSTSSVCPSTNFTLGLQNSTNGTGVTYQWQSSADGVTYANIAGATSSTYTASQTAGTYYQATVTCNGGTAVTSTPIQVTMNSFLNCYCTSAPTYVYDQDILNVTLGSLNNSSTCSSAAGTGSVLNSYSNFTGVAAPTLLRTATYPLSIQIGACTYVGTNMSKVFIDYNQNGLFTDAGEQVYVSPSVFTNAHVESAMITIPVGALLGTTRMRVITNETSNPADITSCGSGSYYYGETEDYNVTIGAAPTCPQPTALAWLGGTTTTAEFDWTPGGTETSWIVEYGAPGFTPGTGTSVTVTGASQTTLSGLPSNMFYQAYVKAVCGGSDQSFNAGPIAFNTYGLGQYMEADNACGTGFIDISGNTAATNLGLADDTEAGVTLPFPVYYQGTIITQATIGNNGGIKFNTTTADVVYTMDAPGVYPYSQDLGTTTEGAVYMQVLGTAPNRQLVVQWNNIPHYGFPQSTDGANFEVVFDEASSEIYFHYGDLDMGNTSWNNGADAEIGVRGTQNINVSINNSTYLSNNDCVHFYYTDCPKPQALTFSNITNDEFTVDWTTGLSNEVEWILEYGPAGFTPGSPAGTVLTDITTSDQQISGLTPLTTYDVYIYAECANGDTSFALIGSVQTLPLCSDPYALFGTAFAEDSINATWNWTETVLPLTGFNLQYGMTGFDLYSSESTTVEADGMNFADTIADSDLMAGVTYQVYVQAVCSTGSGTETDTSNFVGPFTVTMPLTNDTVCYAEPLMVDGTVYHFTNVGATASNTVASNQEQSIAPPNTGLQTTTGWGNSTISYSTWFTFVAPASGQVRISGKNTGFDGQIAVYKVGNCAQFSTFQLIAANDNEIGGSNVAPNFTICGLTPGSTYYLMHDSYTTYTTGNYSIKITPISLDAGATGSLVEVCTGEEVSLFDGITGNQPGGVWTPLIPSIALVDDSIFASAGLAYQTFQFQYRLTDGCAYDSILANVKIFPPSHAGTDGSLVVCRNEPFNLLEGLSGNIDLGGTWYNPTAAVVPAGNTIADNFPGQYNYKYIVGNGVCPNDTAKVIVSVGTCNYLGLEEAAFEGFSLYPNPTEGFVYVSNTGSTEVFNYEVLDVNGRKVMMKENAINGTAVTEINLNAVETGIYMIHVFNGTAEKTFRVVVK